MIRLLLSSLALFVSIASFSQKQRSNKEILDSLKQNDATVKMLDELDKHSSYFKVGVGLGNQLLSVNNKALDASQTNNKLIITPNIGYYHKSGFGISVAGYFLNDSGSTKFYQSALTPSYELDADDFGFGVSYTRYFPKDKYGGSNSPIQNDFYTNVLFKKTWLEPGVALGYSNGIYKEINVVTVNFPNIGPRTFTDTASTKTTALSLIGTIEHTFDFDNIFSSSDLLNFTPAIMLNAGSNKLITTHKNKYSAFVDQNSNRRRLRGNSQSDITSFTLQSVGLNLGITYSIGSFIFEPQLYLDYYLHTSDTKKFTQVYNINAAFTF